MATSTSDLAALLHKRHERVIVLAAKRRARSRARTQELRQIEQTRETYSAYRIVRKGLR